MKKKEDLWRKITKRKKPFFCLAPMYDVTDAPFRQMFLKYKRPDVFFTEFVSADGLSSKEGFRALKHHLIFSKKEKPIILQIFGANPLNIKKASMLGKKLGFDGIDINMGCPDRSVEKGGAGASLIKNPKLAREIIRSAKEGASGLPVSVKTRIGYTKNNLQKWLPELLAESPSAITIHARTRKEMSLVPADWGAVREAVEIRNRINRKVLIVGNGDVLSIEDGIKKAKESGVDGIMIGRATFGSPWFFESKTYRQHFLRDDKKAIINRLKTLREHSKIFVHILKDVKNFAVMKKHFKAYVSGFDGAKDLRIKLMEAKNLEEVETILDEYMESL